MAQPLRPLIAAIALRHRVDLSNPEIQSAIDSEDVSRFIRVLCNTHSDRLNALSFHFVVDLTESLWLRTPSDRMELFELWKHSSPNASGIIQLVKMFKNAVLFQFDLQSQAVALRTLCAQVRDEFPASIVFPGNHDSFLRITPVKTVTNRAYTIAMWIRLEEPQLQDDILLFRCEAATGEGLEVMLTERQRDGRWNVAIRVLGSHSSIPKDRTVIFGTIFLPSNSWQLLTISHAQQYIRNSLFCLRIDGLIEFEQDLHFPFSTQTIDTRWTVGSGLNGRISTFAVYSGDLPTEMLTTLKDNGPGCATLDASINVPQSTYDSGHSILGIQVTKGDTGRKCCKMGPCFVITPAMCDVPTGIPHEAIGLQHVEHVEMTEKNVATEYTCITRLEGACYLDLGRSWSSAWFTAGGTALALKLLWEYCGMRAENDEGKASQRALSPVPWTPATDVSPSKASSTANECVQLCIVLLARLVHASVNLREGFLQIHGFHVVAACLLRMKDKESTLNIGAIDACIELVRSFGADSRGGDGLAAALQGLLFDFRVWGNATRFSQAYLLHAASDLVADSGRALYEGVGIQQIIDVMRLYVCRQRTDVSGGAPVDSHQLACADACHKLLAVALDAAVATRKTTSPEVEVLVLCLEETNSIMLVERLVRALVQLRFTFPEVLRETLGGGDVRFLETTNIQLLTRKGYSAEVRKHAVMLLIWLLSDEDTGLVGRASLKLRQSTPASMSTNSGISPRLLRGRVRQPKAKSSLPGAAVSSSSTLDSQAEEYQMTEYSIPDGVPAALQEPLRQFYRAVYLLQMTNELLKRAFEEDAWAGTLDRIHDITELLVHDGPLGLTNVWIVLPLLDAVLKYSDIRMSQRALMSLSVALKSDEAQVETLCLLPDNLYVEYFVNLAVLAEIRKSNPGVRLPSGDDWQAVETFGDGTITTEEKEIASVCSELALDCLATTLAHHMRKHGEVAWGAWEQLDDCLKAGQTKTTDLQWELKSLQRTTLMVVQRLTRTSEPWNESLIPNVSKLLRVIHERLLPERMSEFTSPTSATHLAQAVEFRLPVIEEQMISFVIEIMASIRKACEVGDIPGYLEGRILIPALEILISHMFDVGSELASKVSGEIFSAIVQLSMPPNQRWFQDNTARQRQRPARGSVNQQALENAPAVSAEEFSNLVFQTLKKCKVVMSIENIPAHISDGYSVLVISLVQYFVDLYKSGDVPPHAAQVADALRVAASHESVADIFRMLDISMRVADSISFEVSTGNDFEVGAPDSQTPDADQPLLHLDDPAVFLDKVYQRRDFAYNKWWHVRQGIIQERVDTERTRLSRTVRYGDYDAEATLRHWKKLRFKIEFECLQIDHDKEWKLGIAHEGPFPGRRRITLRPRYESGPASNQLGKSDSQFGLTNTMGPDELKQALAKAYTGYIRDVTTYEAEVAADPTSPELAPDATAGLSDPQQPGGANPNNAFNQFGNGWGLVDADGSEEGYGVVGLAPGAIDDQADPIARPDHTQDLKFFEDNQKQVRQVETGPCYGGVRRITADRVLQEAEVSMVTPSGKYLGYLSFTARELTFTSSIDDKSDDASAVTLQTKKKMRRRRWILAAISSIYLRRYCLRDSAVEIFFRRGKHRSVFVDFGSTRNDAVIRNEFVKLLIEVAPRTAYRQWPHISIQRMLLEHQVVASWQSGEMSNYDYLMALNTLAGRSFNDLCQYPVFPWVLSQYDQPTIDLDDPNNYRNLSEPMGAINKERLAEFLERYESFSDTDIPKFMYGSHYSTMVGVVLHFLLRLQPFADLHRDVQNGHFDVPDRLFSSIPRAWDHNTNMLSEVKELTPEWFTLPDFLRNVNGYGFGKMQDGEIVDDVQLPPWAKTPEEFIRINRAALESDYVSANLHNWIDLIFGYKQQGPAAVESHNVFYYLTYYGLVDVNAIEDEALRKATELQIAHFGQCPAVLFTRPHPRRKRLGIPRPLLRNFHLPHEGMRMTRTRSDADTADDVRVVEEFILEPLNSPAVRVRRLANIAVRSMHISHHRITAVAENGVVELYKYSMSEEAKLQSYVAPSEVVTSLPQERSPRPRDAATAQAQQPPIPDPVMADLINFTDEVPGQGFTSVTSPAPVSSTVPQDVADFADAIPLIAIEKDREHFEVLARVPYVQTYPRSKVYRAPTPQSQRRVLPHNATDSIAPSMAFYSTVPVEAWLKLPTQLRVPGVSSTQSGKFIMTTGHSDGRVAVRQLDLHTGQVLGAGDFCCHDATVVALSSDHIPRGLTDVIATADCDGLTLIWTISSFRNGARSVISRRPQRAFRGPIMPAGSCSVSWSLGIAATAHGASISIYSIERDEKLRAIDIQADVFSAARIPWTEDLLSGVDAEDSTMRDKPCTIVTFIDLVDAGYIVVSTITAIPAMIRRNSDGQIESAVDEIFRNVMLSYTISGEKTGAVLLPRTVTFLSSPFRADVTITGHEDGSVHFWKNSDLTLLYVWHPLASYVDAPVRLPTKGTQRTPAFPVRATRDSLSSGTSLSLAITHVSVGPRAARPAVFVVCTEGGEIIAQPLRDFLLWEKFKAPSAFAQMVSAPLNAVKGTVQQAQSIVSWTLGGASGLATQARGLAGEAMSEARSIVKNVGQTKVVKSLSDMFGFKRSTDNSPRRDDDMSPL